MCRIWPATQRMIGRAGHTDCKSGTSTLGMGIKLLKICVATQNSPRYTKQNRKATRVVRLQRGACGSCWTGAVGAGLFIPTNALNSSASPRHLLSLITDKRYSATANAFGLLSLAQPPKKWLNTQCFV